MTMHIQGDTGHAAWIIHQQFNKKYYEALECIKDMYDFSLLLKLTLNGNKQAEQISEDVYNRVAKLYTEFESLHAAWYLFDAQGFKKEYE